MEERHRDDGFEATFVVSTPRPQAWKMLTERAPHPRGSRGHGRSSGGYPPSKAPPTRSTSCPRSCCMSGRRPSRARGRRSWSPWRTPTPAPASRSCSTASVPTSQSGGRGWKRVGGRSAPTSGSSSNTASPPAGTSVPGRASAATSPRRRGTHSAGCQPRRPGGERRSASRRPAPHRRRSASRQHPRAGDPRALAEAGCRDACSLPARRRDPDRQRHPLRSRLSWLQSRASVTLA